MSIASATAATPGGVSAGRAGARVFPREDDRTAVHLFGLFVLWAFCNPYYGVERGSLIYAGRAMADLDPAGVGQDMMFRLDGQSAFTLFTPLFAWLAGAVGVSTSTLLVAGGGMVVSFVAAAALAWRIAEGRARYLALAFAAALPASYGGYELFGYAETAATPRPYAEALVLFGIGALLDGRRLLAHALAFGAVLVHPIMALPGVVVIGALSAFADRRWLFFWLAALTCLAATPLLNEAVGRRALQLVDPDWRAILAERNPHLFPSLWPIDWLGRAGARVATLLIALTAVGPTIRRIILMALAVSALGLAATYVFGERLSFAIVLQAQPWRMMWLMFALAPMLAAIVTFQLWRAGGMSRFVLIFLALSWVSTDYWTGGIFAVTAVLLHFAVDEEIYRPSPVVVQIGAGVGIAFVVAGMALQQWQYYRILSEAPPGLIGEAQRTVGLHLEYTPLGFVAAILALLARKQWPHWAVAAGSLAAAVAVGLTWDARSRLNRYFDANEAAGMSALIASKPGEVYWIQGMRGNWWRLRRPHWIATIQGAGLVFSRDVAMAYRERSSAAIEAGLADHSLVEPFKPLQAGSTIAIRAANLAPFCSRPDAPAWIVAPLNGDVEIGPEVPHRLWRTEAAKLDLRTYADRQVWLTTKQYAIIACAI